MQFKTTELPGIGKKISFITAEGNMVVLVVHHSGKREMYFFDDPDGDEADFSISMTSDETRELGAQLLGAMYQPVDMDKMKMFKKQIIIEWVDVKKGSSLVGKTIGQSQIRTKTGASIIGIVKGEDNIAVPDIDVILHEGDVLMICGKQAQISKLTKLCEGGDAS
ncbi:potassium transporter TrkA [Bacillus sp. LL01]|uniref:cation:proton antiporter regulatory subunit n=1 Tax=Bacillus sp. LL01 TaxID=1665556 RepID=UPI00064D0E52|nr:cation:proton antiporter regulatory subunit [Bacillus sp. LL01]KMJ56974.1 potassium transporter TrkA [Bacillus sp. LL01]